MPFAKPKEEETWRSEWIKAANGKAVLLQTSSLGASVAIDGEISVDELREFKESLAQDNLEFEQRWRMIEAMDEVLGKFEGSELARRELEILEVFGCVARQFWG
jgi:DNA-binding NarL/FixJ family response regulator